jgi:alpha,alpha-trehalase
MNRETAAAHFPSAAVYTDPAILAAFHRYRTTTRADCKSFVDRPLTADPARVLDAFRLLPRLGDDDDDGRRRQYGAFFDAFFVADPDASAAQMAHIPVDYTSAAPRFAAAPAFPPDAAAFAAAIKALWPKLCRAMAPEARARADRSSLIPLPHPFFIAGGRFRECYYWDSYWIVKGLLACDMPASARHVVDNLLHLVSLCSFVPNANRVYYLNRSQPPLLALAAAAVLDHGDAPDLVWLRRALPLLDRERETFIASHRAARRPGQPAALQHLAAYSAAASPGPRPESWVEDVATAASGRPRAAADLHRDIAAAAESGWDFSSRWLAAGGGLATIGTSHIVPVCLNSILVATDRALARFHGAVGGDGCEMERRYEEGARARAAAVNEVLWDEAAGMWCDFDTRTGRSTGVVAASGLFPLWAQCWPAGGWGAAHAAKFVRRLAASGLVQRGGLAATATASGEQWDFPNSWPPLADVAVGGLEALEGAFPGCGGGAAARGIAETTLRGMHAGWTSAGVMHEKYDATATDGRRGGGGEYEPQVGFGWTNGVALALMQRGYWHGRQ